MSFKEGWHWFLLAALLGSMAVTYGYPDILTKRPQGLHAWRQADCLSITLNYKDTDTPFHRPRIHYLGHHGDGSAMSDFPLIHFAIGRIWRSTGQQEWIFRALVLSLFCIAMFMLHGMLCGLLRDHFSSLFIVTLVFTSPMLAYYANNFLMNVPAWSMAIIGWAFFWKALERGSRGMLMACLAAFLFAGLLKATAALSLLTLTAILVMHHVPLGRKILGRIQVPHAAWGLGLSLVSILFLAGWYVYAHNYNSANDSGVFLVGTLPIWSVPDHEFRETLDAIRIHLRRDYFRPFVYPLLALALISAALGLQRAPRLLLVISTLLLLGTLSISVLFFGALKEHDYYSLDQLVLVPFLLAAGFLALPDRMRRVLQHWGARLVMLAVLIHCTDFARRRMEDRYAGWMNHEYLERVHWYGTLAPTLETLGISKDSRVISLPDASFNITLYLMDRTGWTDFDSLSHHPDKIRHYKAMGAEYLFVHDEQTLQRLGPVAKQKIGSHGPIQIFRLEDEG